MIRRGHIDGTEATSILVMMIISKCFLNFPSNLVHQGITAAWLLAAMEAGVTGILLLPLVMLLARFPSKNWGEVCEAVLGKYLGKLPVFGVWVWTTVSTGLVLREFGGAFKVSFLPSTPVQVVMVFGLILMTYACLAGPEAIGRLAILLTLPIVLLTGLMYGAFAPQFSLLGLFPFFGPGLKQLAIASLVGSGTFAELVLLAYLNGSLREPKDLPRVAWRGFLISSVFIVVTAVLVVGTMNMPAAHRLIFPLLEISRSVRITSFLQNFTAIFVFLWFFTLGLRIIMGCYLATRSFAELFNLDNLRPLVIIIGFLIFVVGLFPSTVYESVEWDELYVRRWSPFLTILPPAGIFLIAALRGKLGTQE